MAANEYSGYSADNYGYGQPAYPASGGGYNSGAASYGYGQGAFGAYPAPDISSPLDAEIQVVVREIHTELNTLEQAGEYGEQFKNARRLLTTEGNKLENNIDPEWLEVDINKPIKVTKKILIPSFRHPKFNFVGKVLGPKGTTLQNIAKQYKCHVYILGRGSTRDRSKEQELLNSGDPQFAHYGGPLHVKVETTAAPAIAYQRVAGVLQVLSELLIPVKDTHIDGITTVTDEKGDGEQGEGGDDGQEESENGGGAGGGGGNSSGGGPMKGSGGFGAPRGGFGGAPRPSFPGGGRGGGFRGGGMRGGAGGMRGGFMPGRGRGGGMPRGRGGGPRPGFQPY